MTTNDHNVHEDNRASFHVSGIQFIPQRRRWYTGCRHVVWPGRSAVRERAIWRRRAAHTRTVLADTGMTRVGTAVSLVSWFTITIAFRGDCHHVDARAHVASRARRRDRPCDGRGVASSERPTLSQCPSRSTCQRPRQRETRRPPGCEAVPGQLHSTTGGLHLSGRLAARDGTTSLGITSRAGPRIYGKCTLWTS